MALQLHAVSPNAVPAHAAPAPEVTGAPSVEGQTRWLHEEAQTRWPREESLWHPVLAGAALADAPVAVTLLEQDIVVWRDAQGAVHAWRDQCPHRGARLSLGTVRGDALECPYHGWQFAGRSSSRSATEGQCVQVPAQPAFAPSATHRCAAFEAREVHGLVWVRLRPQARVRPPDVPPEWLEPPSLEVCILPDARHVLCGPYEVHTSAARLMENFLDLSHFGFVHAGWLGDAVHAQVDTGDVVEQASRVVAQHCRAFQPRGFAASAHDEAASGHWVHYRYEIEAPFCAHLLKRAQADSGSEPQRSEAENAIALFICPHGEHHVSAWFLMMARNDADDTALRAFQDTVFAQDRAVLQSQRPLSLPIGLRGSISEVHGPADRMSSAYRRLLLRCGITLGVC